ncbi:MAG: VanZ family protein [Betaproteobacteria bacterium]
MPASPRSSRLPEFLAGLYALLIVYASAEPFSGWTAPLPGTPFFLVAPWPPRFTRFDVVVNVLAYAPFGLFVALSVRRTALVQLAVAGGAGFLLSFLVETMQMFIPTRDASAMDLVCNAAGASLGGLSAMALDRTPGLRASVSAWRHRVFVEGRSGDLGLALLAIWLLAQLNPGIPLFAATFDPSLELTRDLAGTLLQAAESAFNVVGVGLFLALLLRQRRFVGGAVLMLIGLALILKGLAASVLIRQSVLETWIKPGVSLGVAAGALVLLLAVWLPRPARTTMCAIALLASLVAPLLAPDMWRARAPLALFDWPYGQLLNFNGLTHAVLIAWPILASLYVLAVAARRASGDVID